MPAHASGTFLDSFGPFTHLASTADHTSGGRASSHLGRKTHVEFLHSLVIIQNEFLSF